MGIVPVALCNTVTDVGHLIDAGALDGIILTGGNDIAAVSAASSVAPERDRFEVALIDACIARAVPVLGVCRGSQIIAHHLGSTLSPVTGHGGTRHEIFSQDGQNLGWPTQFEVNSFHDFAIPAVDLATDLVSLAEDSAGCVEAFHHRTHQIFGIMWHPEREPEPTVRDLALIRTLFGDARQ
jgi:gamma-glutamyl-gamma-aminobutyrate hydrolase PuuD